MQFTMTTIVIIIIIVAMARWCGMAFRAYDGKPKRTTKERKKN